MERQPPRSHSAWPKSRPPPQGRIPIGHQKEETIAAHSTAGMPVIAVTTSELRAGGTAPPTPEADPERHEMVLGLKYLTAIERAGGVPVVVPPLSDHALLHGLLEHVSAVLLTGGPDLDPAVYGASPHERLGPTWRDLDECELALARLADARCMPMLGICRGLQTVNVARGGTLHQHLPDVAGEEVHHRQDEPTGEPTHAVKLVEPSRLAEILGTSELRVNSFHHQAVDALGRGLRPTGHASDGTIESLEAVDRDYVLGVQWHAEGMLRDEHQFALFKSFVDAARQYASGPRLARRAA